MLRQSQASFEFLHHLIRPDNKMPLGDGKLTHPRKPVHFTGIFIPEQGGSLPVPKRQISVGMLSCLVYIILERTGHRTERKHFLILFFIP